METNETLQTILKRRSGYGFQDRPVPEEALHAMLLAAQAAPSGGNGQTHVFGVIRDPAIRDELCTKAVGNELWRQREELLTAPVLIACCARLDEDYRALPEDDPTLTVNYLRFGKRLMRHLLDYDDWHETALLFADGVPLIPGENMALVAESFGLSTRFIGYLDVREASRILRLPDNMACMYVMPVGYRANPPAHKKLRPLEEITFTDRWTDDHP